MQVVTSLTPAITAADQLNQILVEQSEKPVLLMLSGGSALSILQHIDHSLFGPQITITTLDERLSIDPEINNFSQIKSTSFYQQAKGQGVSFIDTSVSLEDDLSQTGKCIEAALQNWVNKNPDGVIIATMGVGSDGHTAGIFPGKYDDYFSTDDWVVAYQLPDSVSQHTDRVTVTPLFLLEQVSHAVVYVVGEEKKSVLSKLQQDSCTYNEMPACILKDMTSVIIVTD